MKKRLLLLPNFASTQGFIKLANDDWQRRLIGKFGAVGEGIFSTVVAAGDGCIKLNSKYIVLKSQLAANQQHDQEFLEAYPSFDYPKTLSEARTRVEAEESRMRLEAPMQPGKWCRRIRIL